ncbi:MAG: sugar phosphate isomerase/epimerase family protein [Verrucomicrobiota bacterium]|nr:sugar phosphate isomerase/epimerase family protein [Verrucomicrobiota bacterium]
MKHHFIFSGIVDEAGKDIATQIRAHKELGWKFMECRNVDGMQFTDLPDEKFTAVCAELAAAGMGVSSFASGIANWACRITDPLEKSTETLARAIVRMNRLGTRYIRVMSWPNNGMDNASWRAEAVARMKILGEQAEKGGITIAVENCDGWASTSADAYAEFFTAVNSPAVKAVYDTGNPCSHGHTNTWEWYTKCRPHIGMIHIKAHTGPGGEHVWPDVGASCVVETLRDLVAIDYRGFVSIEPHLKAVAHEGKEITEAEAAYQTYVEYGRRLMRLCNEL